LLSPFCTGLGYSARDVSRHRRPVWTRALAWVEAERGSFTLPPGSSPSGALARIKAVGELARVASVLLQRPALPADLRPRLTALLEHAWGQFREGRLFAETLEARPDLMMLGSLYSIFDRHGLVHEPTRALLRALPDRLPAALRASGRPLDSGAGRIRLGADSPAVVALALSEAWRCLGLPSSWSAERIYPRTLLARRPEGPIGTAAYYSITHAVYFLTDFGNRPHALDPESRAYLGHSCPRWMDKSLRVPDYDSYSELAFALTCIGNHERDVEVESVLSEAQRPSGMVPGPPKERPNDAEGLGPPAFRRNYHCTLAAMLASFGATAFRP
jgi:hypothetical protein